MSSKILEKMMIRDDPASTITPLKFDISYFCSDCRAVGYAELVHPFGCSHKNNNALSSSWVPFRHGSNFQRDQSTQL